MKLSFNQLKKVSKRVAALQGTPSLLTLDEQYSDAMGYALQEKYGAKKGDRIGILLTQSPQTGKYQGAYLNRDGSDHS